MKSEKDKANEAFIEKIKSITIMGGSKGGGKVPPTVQCPDCGEHLIPVKVIPLGMVSGVDWAAGYRNPRKLPTDEQSFAE